MAGANPSTAMPQGKRQRCPICQCAVQPGEPLRACPSCRTAYHVDCWNENKGCGVYGCSQVPPTEARQGLEVPVSYWGRERKPCPKCGTEIQAAAIRCLRCGAEFDSARPQSSSEYRTKENIKALVPDAQKRVVWLFAFCVIPCTAPIGAIAAGVWLAGHKEEVEALPSLHRALAKMAVAIGAGQSALVLVMVALFAVFKGQ